MAPTLPSLTRRPGTSRKVASPKDKALSRVTAGLRAHSNRDGYPGFKFVFQFGQTFGGRYDKKRSSKPQSRLSIGKREARWAKETVFSRSAGCHCQTSAREFESDADSADEDTADDTSHSEHKVSKESEDCKTESSDVLSNHTEESGSKCDPSTSSDVQESIEVIEVPATPDVADTSVEADANVPSDVLSVNPPTTAQEAERTLEIPSQVLPNCQDPPETSPQALTPSESSSTHSELNRLLESLDITKGSPTPECIPPNPEPQLGSKRPANREWEDGPPTKKQRVETSVDNDANPSCGRSS